MSQANPIRGWKLLLSSLRFEPGVLQALDAGQLPGGAGRLHLDEVRVERLIELVAGDVVLAQADVDRQRSVTRQSSWK